MSVTPTRRASVYVAVLAVVSAVTVLTLTGVALRRAFHARAAVGGQAAEARRLAQSAMELAVHGFKTEPAAFRSAASDGTLLGRTQLGSGGVTVIAVDADTSGAITASTTRFKVTAEAGVGDARSRLSFVTAVQVDEMTAAVTELGAMAYWALDEVSSAVAEDTVGNYDGTYPMIVSAGADTHAHGNSAPRIDWMTEAVTVPHNSAFQLSSGTVAFWVRWDLIPASGMEAAAVVKERQNSNASMDLAIYLSNSYLNFKLDNVSGHGRTITCPISKVTAGKWHFIAAAWGSDGMDLYLDGDLVADSKSSHGMQTVFLTRPANTSDWYFGLRNKQYMSYSQYWPTYGSVARVSLFNRGLTESEVRRLMAASTIKGLMEAEPESFARVVD